MSDLVANRSENLTLFTAKELASYLKIGRDKSYALMKNSAFPSFTIGKRKYVTKEAVNDWLEQNKYKTFVV